MFSDDEKPSSSRLAQRTVPEASPHAGDATAWTPATPSHGPQRPKSPSPRPQMPSEDSPEPSLSSSSAPSELRRSQTEMSQELPEVSRGQAPDATHTHVPDACPFAKGPEWLWRPCLCHRDHVFTYTVPSSSSAQPPTPAEMEGHSGALSPSSGDSSVTSTALQRWCLQREREEQVRRAEWEREEQVRRAEEQVRWAEWGEETRRRAEYRDSLIAQLFARASLPLPYTSPQFKTAASTASPPTGSAPGPGPKCLPRDSESKSPAGGEDKSLDELSPHDDLTSCDGSTDHDDSEHSDADDAKCDESVRCGDEETGRSKAISHNSLTTTTTGEPGLHTSACLEDGWARSADIDPSCPQGQPTSGSGTPCATKCNHDGPCGPDPVPSDGQHCNVGPCHVCKDLCDKVRPRPSLLAAQQEPPSEEVGRCEDGRAGPAEASSAHSSTINDGKSRSDSHSPEECHHHPDGACHACSANHRCLCSLPRNGHTPRYVCICSSVSGGLDTVSTGCRPSDDDCPRDSVANFDLDYHLDGSQSQALHSGRQPQRCDTSDQDPTCALYTTTRRLFDKSHQLGMGVALGVALFIVAFAFYLGLGPCQKSPALDAGHVQFTAELCGAEKCGPDPACKRGLCQNTCKSELLRSSSEPQDLYKPTSSPRRKKKPPDKSCRIDQVRPLPDANQVVVQCAPGVLSCNCDESDDCVDAAGPGGLCPCRPPRLRPPPEPPPPTGHSCRLHRPQARPCIHQTTNFRCTTSSDS